MTSESVPSELGSTASSVPIREVDGSTQSSPSDGRSILRDLVGNEVPIFSLQHELRVHKTLLVDRLIHDILYETYLSKHFQGGFNTFPAFLRSIAKEPLDDEIWKYAVRELLRERHQKYGSTQIAITIPQSWIPILDSEAMAGYLAQRRKISHSLILEVRVYNWVADASQQGSLPPKAMEKIQKEMAKEAAIEAALRPDRPSLADS